MKKKIYLSVIILISIYTGLFLSNIYLYIKYEKPYLINKITVREETIKQKKETIEQLDKIRKDKNNKNIFLNFHYSYKLKNILPLGTNISNSQIIYGKEEYWSIFKTDKYGFFHNSDESYKNPKIILLGDSFAKGCCVDKDYVPSNLLEKEGFKTLNLGTGGGTLIEYATYLEYAKEYMNKIVILLFYEGNDYKDNFQEFNNEFLIRYFNNHNFSQNLKARQSEIDEKINDKIKDLTVKKSDFNFNLINALSLKYFEIIYIMIKNKYYSDYVKLRNKFFEKKEDEIQNVKLDQLFAKFKEITNKNNNQLFVVHIPLSTRFNTNDNSELNEKKIELSKILKKNEIKFLDFTKYIKDNKLYVNIYKFDEEILNNRNYFPIKKRHFNQKGYQELIKFIINNIN